MALFVVYPQVQLSKPYCGFFSISVLYLSCVILLKFINIVSGNPPVVKVPNLVRKHVFSKVNYCVLLGKACSTVVVASFW